MPGRPAPRPPWRPASAGSTPDAAVADLIADGAAAVEGEVDELTQLAGLMVDFDPRFEIMPGTRARTEVAQADPFAAVPRQTIAE